MPRPVVLIAGGSRGIGAATARLAAARGYDVAVNFISNEAAAEKTVAAVKAAGGNAVAIRGDMAQERDIERVFAEAERLGPTRHLVHSSGITGKASRLDAVTADTVHEVLALNSYGALLFLRAAVRRLSTKNAGPGGAIVMLSSMAAGIGGAGEYTWYAAAKGAVDTMTLGVAREVAKEGVRINAVSPGAIDTEIHEPGRIARILPNLPMGRVGTAEEVAEAILFLLSDGASYITGANLHVSGGR